MSNVAGFEWIDRMSTLLNPLRQRNTLAVVRRQLGWTDGEMYVWG